MRSWVAAAVSAVVVAAPAIGQADTGKVTLFPDLQSSLQPGSPAQPPLYLFRPGDGALVLEGALFDVRLEHDGALTILDLSPYHARLRGLNKQRYRRDEPPAPTQSWNVNPPVYDQRGQRAPIRDALPLVPIRGDDPTRNPINAVLQYRWPTPPWVEVFIPRDQHRQLRDATLDLRIQLAHAAAERRAEAALRALPAELEAIWRDERLTEGERRGTIKALGDEADTSTNAGRQAKATIDAFLAKRLER